MRLTGNTAERHLLSLHRDGGSLRRRSEWPRSEKGMRGLWRRPRPEPKPSENVVFQTVQTAGVGERQVSREKRKNPRLARVQSVILWCI